MDFCGPWAECPFITEFVSFHSKGIPSLYSKRSSQVYQVEVIRRLMSEVHSCKLMLSYYLVRYISIYTKQLTYYFKQICIIELSSKYFMVKYSQHMYGDFQVLHSENHTKMSLSVQNLKSNSMCLPFRGRILFAHLVIC